MGLLCLLYVYLKKLSVCYQEGLERVFEDISKNMYCGNIFWLRHLLALQVNTKSFRCLTCVLLCMEGFDVSIAITFLLFSCLVAVVYEGVLAESCVQNSRDRKAG